MAVNSRLMSQDANLMYQDKVRSEKIAKRIDEIKKHPHFREVSKEQIKNFIAKVMTEKNGPYFDSYPDAARERDWTKLPYFIRPCTLFQNTFIISGFVYSCGPEASNDKSPSSKINISFNNFEILFRPNENGFELCTALKISDTPKLVPTGNRKFASLKKLIDHVSKNNFQHIVDLDKVGTEFRVPLASLIRNNIQMNTVIGQYFKTINKGSRNSNKGFDIIFWSYRNVWIKNLSDSTSGKNEQELDELELAKQLSLELDAAKEKKSTQETTSKEQADKETKITKETTTKEPASNETTTTNEIITTKENTEKQLQLFMKVPHNHSLSDVLDQRTIAVLKCFNIGIFYAQQEYQRLVSEKASPADIKDASDNLETIKFIHDGHLASVCRNRMEAAISADTNSGLAQKGTTPSEGLQPIVQLQQKFLDFKQEMIMKETFNVCVCCDEIYDAHEQIILDTALSNDNKLTTQFDSAHVSYLMQKEKYDNYFKLNKAKLNSMEKTRRELSIKLDTAKIKKQSLKEANASTVELEKVSELINNLGITQSIHYSNQVYPIMLNLGAALHEFSMVIIEYHQTIKAIKSKFKDAHSEIYEKKKTEGINKEQAKNVSLCLQYALECSKLLKQTEQNANQENGTFSESDITDEIMSQYKRSEKANGRKAV